ncbi:TIR domain-containing protein [Breoghania sp. JC706]|uniref:TIR domain-containing protein n=1 Tax=Breoghania sp. JC706 TaxID=3117732 RepID=UPI00300B87C9
MSLLGYAEDLQNLSEAFKQVHHPQLKKIMDEAVRLQESWSGSNMGYHAYVYYSNLSSRPPGAQFSPEWGLMDMSFTSMGSVGDWQEYPSGAVKEEIERRAGNPDITLAIRDSAAIREKIEDIRDEIISELTVALDEESDEFLRRLKDEAEKISLPTADVLGRAMLPSGQVWSRDSNAISGGLHLAPHQEVIAKIAALQIPADECSELSKIARKAGSHLGRRSKKSRREERIGTNVFIGHGRSPLWRELKDFVVGRLGLPYEEFNRVPVAGVTNIARLSEMLDGAACALVVLTAEDEMKDGSERARMNVIHEVGLFQGRLGFTKAIVLLEEGCAEFSNIQGLGQIRFPRNNIAAAFEEVRAVLEREGVSTA